MSTTDVAILTAIVLVPAALLWLIFVVRTGRPGRGPRPVIGIPHALRPGEPDEKLEGPRLMRIQLWGLIATVATAAFIPIYWLPERQRQEAFAERFEEESLERGRLIFSAPPVLEEDADPAAYKEEEKAIALGQNCAACHGPDASGGTVEFVPPGQTEKVTYQAPRLDNVFQRWDEEVVRFTIERGRPGTPMPPWGVEYGGPMTELMIDDVIAWLKTLPGNQEPPECWAETDCSDGQEIFEARCAICHGPQGQGKENDELWFQGMALWQGDVASLSEQQHYQTILNGRRFAYMPQFGESPSQGIPPPLYPLSEEQIRAVMEYERSL